MLKNIKCIDFHAHPVIDAFRKAMENLGIDPMEEDGFPLPDVDGTLEETAYVLDTLGAAGLKVATNMGGIYLGNPLFDPVMEE